MPRRPNNDDECACAEDPRLVLELLAHFNVEYKALIFEEDVRKILGFTPAALTAAIRIGILVPSHPGPFKVRQYAAVQVCKVFFNGRELIEAACAGVEAVELKNKRATVRKARPSNEV